MKHFLSILSIFLMASCSTNAGTGSFTGGVFGASFGSISGGGSGALIGTATGMIAGSLIGAMLDEQDRNIMEQSSPRTVDRMDRNEPLTINDVIKLSQGGVSDDTILSYMHETFSTYNLSRAQTRRLQEAGVSQRVINHMLASKK